MLTGNKDVDMKILNNLSDKDLISYCTTNKKAKVICDNQTFWQTRTISKFGAYIDVNTMNKFRGDRNWSDYYIELSNKDRSKYPAYEAAKALEYGREDITNLMKAKGIDMVFIQSDDVDYYQDKSDTSFIPKSQGRFVTYRNGKIASEGDLIDTQRVGQWKAYYPGGELLSVQNYYKYPVRDKKGNYVSLLDGEQFKYDEDGDLYVFEIWKKGKLVKRQEYV